LQKALGGDLGPLSVQKLREAIHQAVLQRITRILGVARRTRRVVTGVSTVAETLARGGLRLVFSSRDTLPGPGAAFQAEAERRGIPVVTIFSPGDLHSAFGGPSHGAIGLLDGGCAEGVLRSLRYRIPLSTQEKALEGAETQGRGGGRRG
ncbi:MAG: L7Ae/L30e/S12e/Gadd45 family ribosomal protein, partial [Candidatus Methylomirabilales bacterium]